MRRWLWIGICVLIQLQGTWLFNQYRLYASPYLTVVCEEKMRFHDSEIDLVKSVDVWKAAEGIRLRVPDPMKPEYHIYTDNYQSVVRKLLRDRRVISVSYRRFIYASRLKKQIGIYIAEWIGIAFLMMESIRYHIPENKKRLLRMTGDPLSVTIRKCAMGFTVSSFLAFLVVLFMIHGKIIDRVPIWFCGIIGLAFIQLGNLLEIIYLHR